MLQTLIIYLIHMSQLELALWCFLFLRVSELDHRSRPLEDRPRLRTHRRTRWRTTGCPGACLQGLPFRWCWFRWSRRRPCCFLAHCRTLAESARWSKTGSFGTIVRVVGPRALQISGHWNSFICQGCSAADWRCSAHRSWCSTSRWNCWLHLELVSS